MNSILIYKLIPNNIDNSPQQSLIYPMKPQLIADCPHTAQRKQCYIKCHIHQLLGKRDRQRIEALSPQEGLQSTNHINRTNNTILHRNGNKRTGFLIEHRFALERAMFRRINRHYLTEDLRMIPPQVATGRDKIQVCR